MAVSFDVTDILERVPTPSTVALEVLRLVDDERADVADLTSVLERDPGLAARVLALANSAFYSRGRDVTTLGRAALVLGTRTLKVAALGFALADGLPRDGVRGGLPLPVFWTRSVVQATASRSYAAAVGSTRREEAYLAGLLADIGRIGFALAMPDEYERLVEQAGPWPGLLAEQGAFGMTSADFGSLLVGSWGLPSLYVWSPLLAQGHATTSSESDEVREVAPIVHLAAATCEVLFSRRPQSLSRVHDQANHRFGLGPEVVDRLVDHLNVEMTTSLAQLSIVPPAGFELVALVDRARRSGLRLAAEADRELRGVAAGA